LARLRFELGTFRIYVRSISDLISVMCGKEFSLFRGCARRDDLAQVFCCTLEGDGGEEFGCLRKIV
jgi:hypothetical protein